MSIRPRFAEAILDGEKTVELRRRRPSLPVGARVLIYASSPTQHVIGWFEVGNVVAERPTALWEKVRDRAGVSRQEFRAYFAGCDLAYAIEITATERVSPVALPMRPPQSWQFLDGTNRRHRGLLRLAV
jgi:predicted transcriptional regulator